MAIRELDRRIKRMQAKENRMRTHAQRARADAIRARARKRMAFASERRAAIHEQRARARERRAERIERAAAREAREARAARGRAWGRHPTARDWPSAVPAWGSPQPGYIPGNAPGYSPAAASERGRRWPHQRQPHTVVVVTPSGLEQVEQAEEQEGSAGAPAGGLAEPASA